MALTRVINLKMFADTAAAQAKLDAIFAEGEKLGELNPQIKPEIDRATALKQMAVLRAELKAQGDAAGQDLGTGISDGTKKGLGSQGAGGGSWIVTAIGLGAPLTGPLAAAGLAFGAFGGLAVKSLLPVEKAMTGPGGLSAGWVTLDARQRTAAAGVQALESRYGQLSKAMEPRTFQVFNTLLSTANSLLGPSARLATTSGAAVEGFLVKFENDSGLRQFIGYASTIAPQAISLLGTDVSTLVHSVLTLAQAAGGTGLLELRLLTGGLQILDTVITHLPGPLEGTALGVTGILLGLSKLGVLMPLLRLSGLAGALGAAKAVMAATAVEADAAAVATAALGGAEVVASAETGVLAAAMAALDAVNPFVWVGAAIVGLGALVIWLGRFKSSSDTAIGTIEQQNKATGFNTSGYFAAAKALGQYSQQTKGTTETLVNLHTGVATTTTTIGNFTGATGQLTAAQQKLVTEGRNQEIFLGTLESKYGITRDAAVSLAEHSGVLASDVNKGGKSMRDAATQAEAYANSNLAARGPVTQLRKDIQDYSNATLTATVRQKALTDALSLFFNPAVTADQATLTLKQDQQALAKALQASGGETKGLSGKQGAARGAFDTYISQVGQTATSVFNATGKTSDYTKIINDALPFLERAAGKNRALRKEIQDLISTERGMRSETVSVKVLGSGHWVVTGGGAFGNKPIPVAASGLFVSQGRPGVDDQLILAQRDELIVPPPIVRSGAVDHLRGRIPGFAAGGVVGSYSGSSLPGLDKWLMSENSQTISAISAAVAAATAAGIKSAAAAASSGGGGFGHAGPGGGAPSANAALARSMFPGEDWAAWNYVAMRESGWSNIADNASSGAYGIAQALPPSKYPLAGRPPSMGGSSNPAAQISWMEGYMRSRYGGAGGAAAHERAFNWYAGGTAGAAPGWAMVGEAGPELVKFHGGETVLAARSVRPAVSGGGGAGGGRGPVLSARQIIGLALAAYYQHPQSATADRAEEKKYLRDIAKYFDGSSAKWRDKAVERQTAHLISVGDKITAVTAKMAAARSYQQSVQQGLSGYADLSQMTLGGSMQGSRKLSGAQSLNQQLHGQLGNLKAFASVLRKLSAAKVDSSLIRQVVALGPGDGTAFGQEILAAGPALIKSLNATESAIGKTETQISRGAASAVYEGKYQPGKDFLKQLQHDKAGLKELFRDLGQELGKEATKWFHVPRRRRPKGMAAGGMITEPIYGYGASGQEYMFGERGAERVTPLTGGRSGALVQIGTVNVREAADIGILSQKVGFAISAAGLG